MPPDESALSVAAALEFNAAIWRGDPDLPDQPFAPALTTEAMDATSMPSIDPSCSA